MVDSEIVKELDEFCNCENSKGEAVWDFDDDGMCRLYGTGIKCPLAAMSRKHMDRVINNCSFNHPEYSGYMHTEAYVRVKQFKENNPHFVDGKLGKEDKSVHDNTYQEWAPGGGCD